VKNDIYFKTKFLDKMTPIIKWRSNNFI